VDTVESTRLDHKSQSQELLSLILKNRCERKHTGNLIGNRGESFPTTFRIGLSGNAHKDALLCCLTLEVDIQVFGQVRLVLESPRL
jgi:hypothetical protein